MRLVFIELEVSAQTLCNSSVRLSVLEYVSMLQVCEFFDATMVFSHQSRVYRRWDVSPPPSAGNSPEE